MKYALIIKYIFYLLALSLAILVTGMVILKNTGHEQSLQHLYFLGTLFALSAMLFHFGFFLFYEKYPKRFAPIFMALTIVKLLLYLSVVVIYIFKMEHGIKTFLVLFLGMYVIYSVFEVVQLIKHLKNKQSEGLNK